MVSSLFIAHGSPTLALENNEYTRFLKNLGKSIKPKAIVVFTAHFESNVTSISFIDGTYDMIYDFGGFPDELYSIKYPAKGSIKVASQVQERLENAGIPTEKNITRGLDHGAWVVLRLLYPDADIPVVQVSVNPMLSADKQYEIGKALRGLGDEDILVIGSGGTVHNLWTVKWGAKETERWAIEFDDWLIDKMQHKDVNSILNYKNLAPHVERAVPREEHIVPLFIAMGSGSEGKTPKILSRFYDLATLSYLCIEF